MPTYEYKCQKCGHSFESFHGMTDEPLTKCPECSGKIKRLISPGAGIIFKGKSVSRTDCKHGCPMMGGSNPTCGCGG